MNTQRFDPRTLSMPRLGGQSDSDAPVTPRLSRPFLTVMGGVAALAGLYNGLIASPMYVSEPLFTVHSQQPSISANVLTGIFGGSAGVADLVAVQDYIQSPAMAKALDDQFQLRKSYSEFRPDLPNWLPPGASDESFLKFYQRMITVEVDRDAAIIDVKVRTFDKASAAPIAQTLLQRTEAFVDGMTQRVRTSTMQGAQSELTRAQNEAQAARNAVSNFRGSSSAVDPAAAGAQLQAAQGALNASAAAAQSDLASALAVNKPNSPTVRQLQARLNSIRSQAAQFKAQQGAGSNATNIPRQVTSYETLVVQRSAAEQRLLTAQTAYDAARIQAQQQEKYVVRVVEPNTPTSATEPRRLRNFLMVMVFALAGYAIISLLVAGIRDHQGI